MSETLEQVLALAKAMHTDIQEYILPPAAGSLSTSDSVIYRSLLKGTRDYIEQIGHEINGTYENGWYNACAVMIRRLVETLIIETFEAHNLAAKIQNNQGEFVYLSELVPKCIGEPTWNLSRNAKRSLPKLKDVGDRSAHNRRFLAHRHDIDNIKTDLRDVAQELLSISKLKT